MLLSSCIIVTSLIVVLMKLNLRCKSSGWPMLLTFTMTRSFEDTVRESPGGKSTGYPCRPLLPRGRRWLLLNL